jgi:hypothetical protein
LSRVVIEMPDDDPCAWVAFDNLQSFVGAAAVDDNHFIESRKRIERPPDIGGFIVR